MLSQTSEQVKAKNRDRQMRQLARHQYYHLIVKVENGEMTMGEAMYQLGMAVLGWKERTTVEDIWLKFCDRIASGDVPRPGKTSTIGHVDGVRFQMIRQKNGETIQFRAGFGIYSETVAGQMRDDTHISSAYASVWGIIDRYPAYNDGDARERFDEFCERAFKK